MQKDPDDHLSTAHSPSHTHRAGETADTHTPSVTALRFLSDTHTHYFRQGLINVS